MCRSTIPNPKLVKMSLRVISVTELNQSFEMTVGHSRAPLSLGINKSLLPLHVNVWFLLALLIKVESIAATSKEREFGSCSTVDNLPSLVRIFHQSLKTIA